MTTKVCGDEHPIEDDSYTASSNYVLFTTATMDELLERSARQRWHDSGGRNTSVTVLVRVALVCGVTAAGLIGFPRVNHPGNALAVDLVERTEHLEMGVIRLDYGRNDDDALASCPYDAEPTNTPGGALVGFQHAWDEQLLGDCQSFWGYEIVASPDVRPLKQRGAKVVQHARLLYEETPALRRDPWTASDTCVGDIAGAFENSFRADEGPATYDTGASREGANAWDVTGVVRSWFTGSAAGSYLLLRGHLARDQHGHDNAACVSALNEVRLEILVLAEPQEFESGPLPSDLIQERPPAAVNRLPGDLVIASTPMSTTGPIAREKQDVDVDVLIFRTATPSPATTVGPIRPPERGVAAKPGGDSQLVRAVTSTPTRTPEPMFVPRPNSPFVQGIVSDD